MARGINKVILVGTLGNDPETKYMPSGGAVVKISIATNETWTDKNTGQKQERTEWHRIVAFNRLAEIMGQYLRKGSQVYIEGKLRTNKWQDQSGQDRYTTEIVASEMQMLGSRSSGTDDFYGNNQPQQPQQAMPNQQPQQTMPNQQQSQQAMSNQQQPQYQPQAATPPAAPPTPSNPSNQGQPPAQPSQAPAKNFDDFDDDIPF